MHTLAVEAAKSKRYDQIECFVWCWSRSGTLDRLESEFGAKIHYTKASNELSGLPKLLKYLRNGEFQLVFSTHTHVNALCSFLRKIGHLKTKRLVSRESTMMFARSFGWKSRIFRSLYKLYGAQDLVICQTQAMHAALTSRVEPLRNLECTVAPNPVDFERIYHGSQDIVPSEIYNLTKIKRLVVWCGRFHEIKNPSLAIRTLHNLITRGISDLHLVMIGEGPQLDETRHLSKELGISDSVTFTGYLNNPTAVMKKCQIGLLTSIDEGFPNVILEMLATGVNSFASTNCTDGLADIPGVHLANEQTPESLATALIKALNHSQEVNEVNNYLNKRHPNSIFNLIAGDIDRSAS